MLVVDGTIFLWRGIAPGDVKTAPRG